jgi:hypothetical protein
MRRYKKIIKRMQEKGINLVKICGKSMMMNEFPKSSKEAKLKKNTRLSFVYALHKSRRILNLKI